MVNRGELTYGQDVNAIKILQKRKKPNYPTVSNDQSFDNKETSMLYSPLAVVKNNKQMEGLVFRRRLVGRLDNLDFHWQFFLCPPIVRHKKHNKLLTVNW